jgi:PAS domain S-box-containing protein
MRIQFNIIMRCLQVCALSAMILLGAFASPALAQTPPPALLQATPKHILLLYSYGYGGKGVEIFSEGFRSTMTEAGFSVSDMYFEYLDLERNKADPQYRARVLEMLRSKYAARPIDVIVTVQQPALDFLLHEGKDIAPQAPIITVQAPLPTPAEAGARRVRSQLAKFDIKGTLERALALFPATERVVFVSGRSEADRKMAAEAATVAKPWEGKLAFEYTFELAFDAMLARLATLPPHTVIIFTQYNRDPQGLVKVAYEVENRVVKLANAPVFGLYDFNLANGGIGGSVVSVKALGQATGQTALDLLSAKLQLSEPISSASMEVISMFDWGQIKRWGGDPERLGRDTVFVNRTPTFMEQYGLYVAALLAFLLAQFALIAGLLVSRHQRALAARLLRESEENLSITLHSIGDAVMATDPAGRVTRMNPVAERLTGWSLAQAGGRPLAEVFRIVNASTRQAVTDPVQLVMAKGQVVGLANHTVLLAKGGQEYQIADSAAPIHNAEGTIVGVVLVFSDVTEKYQVEAALRESHDSLRSILQTAHDGFWRLDAQGTLLEVNPSYCRKSGYSEEELIGMRIPDLEALESAADTAKHIQRVIEDGGGQFESAHRRKDGSVWPVEVSVAFHHAGEGQMFVFVRDISERKQAQEALQVSLKEKVALLNEVHHRVKNNLQVITSLLRLEGGRCKQSDTRAVLVDMQGRIRSMALLHESLYRTGIFASIDLGYYLSQIATQAFRNQADQTGAIRLRLELNPLQVGMDQATPCGLLVNELISNCLKHGFPEGHTGEVSMTLGPVSDSPLWRLVVRDNGVGLPADFEEKRTSSLGLQLVGDLSAQIKGTLDIDLAPGVGATFTVTFAPDLADSATKPV